MQQRVGGGGIAEGGSGVGVSVTALLGNWLQMLGRQRGPSAREASGPH